MHTLSELIENLLRLVILGGFGLLFYKVISEGTLLQLIHPQFTYNAKLGYYLLLILIIIQTIRLFDSLFTHWHHHPVSHRLSTAFYGVFVCTLVITLAIPVKPLGAFTAEQKGMKYLNSSMADRAAPLESTTARSPQKPAEPVNAQASPKPVTNSSVTVIDDTNHVRLITAMYENTSHFIDKTIQLKGFVYRPNSLKANQFMVVRFEITCCAADGMPSGLLVEWNDASVFTNNTWVEAEGKIRESSYEGVKIPLLQATKISRIAPLPNPYVYTNATINQVPDIQH